MMNDHSSVAYFIRERNDHFKGMACHTLRECWLMREDMFKDLPFGSNQLTFEQNLDQPKL